MIKKTILLLMLVVTLITTSIPSCLAADMPNMPNEPNEPNDIEVVLTEEMIAESREHPVVIAQTVSEMQLQTSARTTITVYATQTVALYSARSITVDIWFTSSSPLTCKFTAAEIQCSLYLNGVSYVELDGMSRDPLLGTSSLQCGDTYLGKYDFMLPGDTIKAVSTSTIYTNIYGSTVFKDKTTLVTKT